MYFLITNTQDKEFFQMNQFLTKLSVLNNNKNKNEEGQNIYNIDYKKLLKEYKILIDKVSKIMEDKVNNSQIVQIGNILGYGNLLTLHMVNLNNLNIHK